MTDPIADMLTRIRNALAVKKPEVLLPFSKIKYAIAKVLEKENFIEKVEKVMAKVKKRKFEEIKITFKYQDGEPAIKELKRVSKPGCRIYVKSKEMRLNKGRIFILSTSRGIMTSQEAKKRKLGGEILCEIF